MNNVNEYGQPLYANIGEDVSTNIGLTFTIEPQVGLAITRDQTEGVSVGAADITIGDTLYKANEHLIYIVQDGDLSRSGSWRKQAKAKISTAVEKVGNYERFTVLP